MPLPNNYSAWENLQDCLRRTHNRLVREEFYDADDDSIATPRAQLKQACLLDDGDSVTMTVMRYLLFYFDVRKAQDLQAPIYGIPTETHHQKVKFRPQVRLYFTEPLEQVETDYDPVDSQICFRLMNETSETLTEANAKTLANKVKSAMTTAGRGYTWHRGRDLITYRDEDKGYNFQLYAFSEAEAKKVIEQVLDIQAHTPDWHNLVLHDSRKTFPIVPGMHRVYGKSRRKPRERPVAYVRFRYAELKLWGLFNDITLVDTTGFRKNPLIRV